MRKNKMDTSSPRKAEHNHPKLKQVKLSDSVQIRRKAKYRLFGSGIVADKNPIPLDASGGILTADQIFPPIIPRPIIASNGGGAIATGVPYS